ncbi:MAG: VWA domain-containing protein [Candidatus Solibacter usitatus]|nr:VWA domain-containing protein [Candidatus Solibacter usitatus]
MRMKAALCLCLVSLLPTSGQETTFSTDVKVVNVFATVRDKQGKIVRNLTKDDFALDEDSHPQTIRYFAQEINLPLTLGLLIDTSMSQRRVLSQERTASYTFLERVLREDKDRAFVIHFDREVELLQDLTSSRKKLESALGSVDAAAPVQRSAGGRPGGSGRRGGGTMLYDSVLLASDELMKKQTGRKALILLSDGVDNGSKVSLSTAIESAQRADTLVYSVLFADPDAYGGGGRRGGYGRGGRGRYPQQSRPDGRKILERLSRETGGGFFEVTKKQSIEQIYDRIEEELRNQYSLGYTSTTAGTAGGFRKIQVTTPRQKGLIVQTRDGYYPAR